MTRIISFGLVGLLLCVPPTAVAFDYDEAIDGELSKDGMNPTLLSAQPGHNYVAGSINGTMPDFASDFLTFTVTAPWELAGVLVTEYSEPTDTTFLGVEQGTTYVTGQQNENYFGYTLFGTAHLDADILVDMGASNGNFTPPLTADDYTFWVNEGGPPRDYQLDFVILHYGDMNCDDQLDFDDINPFVEAMITPDAYAVNYPGCPLLNADLNRDWVVDFDDINAFVSLIVP